MIQENNRTEFKAELNDKLEKEVVAFLNNREGGVLYIGLDDDGTPVGVPDLDGIQLKIADRIKNNILPSTLGLFDIISDTVGNVPVIKIIISSGLEKPYYIKKSGMSPSGCFIRMGTSSQPMTTSMIDELYSKRIHTTLRNIQSPRQDLTFAQLKIYYQECGLELNEKFANSLELLTPDGKYNYIAYLLADENGVSIKVAKYAGNDKVDLIENEEYGYCSLIKATNQVMEKLKIENSTMTKVTSTKRIEKNLVAPIPMREAVINTIVHSDFSREIPPVFEIFSDRMVFTSYGGLIPGQSEQDFFSCSSMPRNRELMRVFKDVGLVEQLGSGMSRILKVYDKSIFNISEHFIKVEFPFSMPKDQKIIASGNENGNEKGNEKNEEQKALEILKSQPAITAKEMACQIGVSTRTIGRVMKSLRDKGMISRVGSDRKGYWKIHEE
ncbi:MAG: putative DNA binding domain-containing protein [Lachnospiraceae bacterium]|nr:putative DNA binding domain-containing protein [Lachnospiraceae bacterium]HCJ07558.1 transcriptional regulator [Lachnospiraceae bacterium]